MLTNWRINRIRRKIEALENKAHSLGYIDLLGVHTKLIEKCNEARTIRERHPHNIKAIMLFDQALNATEGVAHIIWDNN